MKCDKHRMIHVGGCMWCGRRLCESCVARRERSKIYCDKCRSRLGVVRREHLPKIGKQPLPVAGKRFIFRNGYLELRGRQ